MLSGKSERMSKSILTYLFYAAALTIVSFGISSCNREQAPDCFQTAGEEVKIRRETDDFTSIELRDYLQIELCDSAEKFIEITGPKNLLPDILTEVDNGTLRISNSNTCNFVRSFKKKITVRIYAPEFTDIQNHGTGDVTSVNTLKGSFFKIENRNSAGTIRLNVDLDSIAIATHTGVTDAIITGSSGRTFLFNQGVGLIDSRHLNSASVFVNNSSINDVFVNTSGYMYAYIKFSGNIYYHGQPTTIDKEIIGSGNVVEIE